MGFEAGETWGDTADIDDDIKGVLISYTFTAGDGTFNATFENDTVGNWVQGYSLQAVPEPSTAALLGLGGFSLILRRRK